MPDLADRLTVVTGADGLLGPVWVDALLDAGARVVALCEPGRPRSDRLQEIATRSETSITIMDCDVRDDPSVRATARLIEAEVGPVDVLVANAGVDTPPGRTATFAAGEFPADLMRMVLDVNVVGSLNAMQAFGVAMAERGRGSIIAIGSIYASSAPMAALYDHIDTDPPFLKPPAYGASKAALVNLTRWLAVHWAERGVRVNTLSPGGVAGNQDPEFVRKFNATVPMHRMCRPEELAGPLLFLASDASSYITGIDLLVDGGRHAW